MAMRHGGAASLASGRATVKARHLGVGGGLVDENDLRRIEVDLPFKPRLTRRVHRAAALFGSVRRLFLRVILRRLKNRHSVPMATGKRKRSGPAPRPPSKEPDPRAQRNFTDPDSRVLLTKDGFVQGCNAQAAVDGAKLIIVAHGLTQSMSDCPQLVPLVDAVRANLGRKPREISADAGYCSEDNLLALRPGRSKPMSPPGEPSIRPRPRVSSAAR